LSPLVSIAILTLVTRVELRLDDDGEVVQSPIEIERVLRQPPNQFGEVGTW
jgi:hypothetical protein